MDILEQKIKVQGDIVRKLKAAKAGATTDEERASLSTQIKDEVAKLLSLKAEKEASSSAPSTADETEAEADKADAGAGASGQVVTPWEVEGGEDGIDYDRLLRDFGTQEITPELIARVEELTGKPAHPWLRRGLFFSHRDLKELLDAYEAGTPFYVYTGRGPSSDSMHVGHLIPFLFTKYLQDAFDVPLVIQMTDDEKFLWKNMSLDDAAIFLRENVKDIIAVGFDPAKTFIFADTDYIQHLYPNVLKIRKATTGSMVRAIFGFTNSDNIGKWGFPAVQAAPSFASTFPHMFGNRRDIRCLIPAAIDQDPYFRLTRDVAPKLGYLKPSLIYTRFFPGLQGAGSKMGSSSPMSAIFLTDSKKQIKKKIGACVSGGGETIEEHRANGANLARDIPFQYLEVFLDDDARLEEIRVEYSAGRMLTGEVKKELIAIMADLVANHQAARAKVTDEQVTEFMSVRSFDHLGLAEFRDYAKKQTGKQKKKKNKKKATPAEPAAAAAPTSTA
ncbi:T2-TrpRS [Thecamonas trahens ATCC 50062]|uniref:Tryptophan--tRNA ligase, cytoplasmic n=1 Tax=Thecamonas trahens ATCC 50062 TaxID=461836 RepID=A0A0L0DUQ0_THETB|nr:T2-TrpRS [Thecamonas trahens ATCC 50062]KNC55218.1 T2-TrpRS [Thecamonas trahens ATCC 50062]|eukprot:XP_013753148.1 T2-TrpRS [Thecamonas trahens ATCC 50062]